MKTLILGGMLLLNFLTLTAQIDATDFEHRITDDQESIPDDFPEWFTVCLDDNLITKVEGYLARHGAISDWEELFRINGITLDHIECLYENFGQVFGRSEYRPTSLRFRLRHDIRPFPGDKTYGVDQYGQLNWQSIKKEFHFQWETDRTEWQQLNPKLPADFISAYLTISDLLPRSKIILGDFSISHGQGLLCYAGLFASPGSGAANLIRVGRGVRGYRSKTESGFYRGGAITKQLGAVKDRTLSFWYSRSALDANLRQLGQGLFWQSLDMSGEHGSISGMDKKNALGWESTGTLIRVPNKNWNLYTMLRSDNFDHPFNPGNELFRAGLHSYRRQKSASVAFDGQMGSLTSWGEFVVQSGRGIGFLHGLSRPVGSKMNITLISRYANAHFHSPFSGAFFKRNPPRNEWGIYASMEARLNSKWLFNAYWNTWFFTGVRYLFDTPSSGIRFFSSLSYIKRREHHSSFQFLLDKDDDPEHYHRLFQMKDQRFLSKIRIHHERTPNKTWRMMARMEFSGDPRTWGKRFGHLLYWDVLYHPIQSRWRISARLVWTDIPSYSSRISAFESDVLGRFRIFTYSESMVSFTGSLRRKFSDFLTVDLSSKLLMPCSAQGAIWNHSIQLQFGFSSESRSSRSR